MSKLTTTAKELLPKGSKTDSSMKPQYSAISEISSIKGSPKAIREWLMQLQQGSPVSHSRLQENEKARKTIETFGLKLSNAFALYDLNSRSWKTFQVCLFTRTLDEFSGTWPRQGLMLDGVCWEQMTLVFPIIENAPEYYYNTPCAGSEHWSGRFDEAGGSRNKYRGTPIAREKVNPPWWEWLMGWPIGWTDLKPLETDRFQQWLKLHGKS